MNKEEKRVMFFDMQEHPEKYSDEEMRLLLEDEDVKDLFENMAEVKRAVLKDEFENKVDSCRVDEEWTAFENRHFGKHNGRRWLRVAVLFAGAVFLSGAVFAFAVQMGFVNNPFKTAEKETIAHEINKQNKECLKTKTEDASANKDSVEMQPVTFDKIEFGHIITEMAAYYHVKVVFHKEETRTVRLYFVWNRRAGLQHNIELLNGFDRINIAYKDNIITIE